MITAQVGDHDTAGCAVSGAHREVRAVLAFIIVNDRHVVRDLDRAVGADLLAFLTADTAAGADLARDSALVLVAAGNENALNVSHQRDQVVRTFLGTHAASNTILRIDARYTVVNANSALGTDSGAVAKTETAVGTVSFAAVKQLCRLTGLDTLIFHLILRLFTVAGTVYNCDLFNYILKFNTQYLTELS